MDNNGLVLQSSIGGRLVDSKLVAKTNQLSFARIKSVNYQKNTVVFVLITDTGAAETTQGVAQEAMLPMVSAGRNGFGHAYGEIAPVHPGDIVLLGFVGENANNPIVIARYGDSTITNEVANQSSPDYSPTDFSSYAKANQGIIVYPDMTYDLHDGRGNLALTFSGNTFLLVRPDTPKYSDITDDTATPISSRSLPGAVDGNGDPRYSLVQNAPEIIFGHSGNINDAGTKDNHKVYLYIGKDGHFRLSSMQDDQDWRTYFEETPDGQIRLRRQEDSKIFGAGAKSSEISIDSNGYVNIRSQSTGLILRPDGIYNLDGTKFTADTDLSDVWTSIHETQEGIKKNTAQITVNSTEIATKVSTDALPAIIDDQMKPYTDNLKELQDSYTDMQKTLDNMASDGVISSSDKKSVRTIWLQIQTEYPSIVAQAVANKVDHSSLDGAYNTLKAYIEPILADTSDTTVDPTEWDRNFSNYYTSAYNTNTAIVASLQSLAQSGYDKAVQASGEANNALTIANQATDANYLTGSDKASLNRNWIQIQNNYPNDVASAEAVSLSHTDLDNAYNALNSYIETSNIFATDDTAQIDATELATKVKAYYDAEASLMKQVADKNIATLEQYGQDIDHQATAIQETSSKIALSAENIQKHDDKLSVMQGQLSVMANEISAGLSETDVTGLVNNSLAGNDIGTMNQFVVSTATKGQYLNGTNGATTSSSNGIISDYIVISPSKEYSAEVYGVSTATKLSVAWYDSNKSFISGTEVSQSSNIVNKGTSPSNGAYAKVSTDDNTKNVMFILGDAPETWSPSYTDAKGNVDSANQILKSLQDSQSSVAKLINGNTNKNNVNTANIDSMFYGDTLSAADVGILNALLGDTQADNTRDNSLATQFSVDPSALNNLYDQLTTEITSITSQAIGSNVDIDAYKSKLTGYYSGRDTFLKAVKAKADAQVASAQDAVNDASSKVNQIVTNKYDNFNLTVDGLSNTVGETQTIANNAQAAANKAQGDVNALSTTTTNKFSQIQQTTDDITQTVAQVTSTANNASDKINNLQVGGANILLNTLDYSSWQKSSGLVIDSSTYPYTAHYPSYKASSDDNFLQYTQLNSLVAGTSYTLTFTAKGSGKLSVYVYPHVSDTTSDNFHQYQLTSTIQTYSFTFIASSTISGSKNVLFRNPAGNTLEAYISQVKLEVGNTATAWSPAPADNASASDLATTNQNVSTIQKQTATNWSVFAQGIGGTAAGISVDANGTVSITGQLIIGSDFIAGNITGKTITGSTFGNTSGTFKIDENGNIKGASLLSPNITVPFSHVAVEGSGIKSTGTLTLNGASYVISGDVEDTNGNTNGQNYHTELNPDGLLSYITQTDGTTQMHSAQISMGTLTLSDLISGTGTNAKYNTASLDAWRLLQLQNNNTMAWQGVIYPQAGDTATMSIPLSNTLSGWLVAWSYYTNGAATYNEYAYTLIPKVALRYNTTGANWMRVTFTMKNVGTMYKLIWYDDTHIVGTAENSASPRNQAVMTEVYAV